jgi:hypothetical protein
MLPEEKLISQEKYFADGGGEFLWLRRLAGDLDFVGDKKIAGGRPAPPKITFKAWY